MAISYNTVWYVVISPTHTRPLRSHFNSIKVGTKTRDFVRHWQTKDREQEDFPDKGKATREVGEEGTRDDDQKEKLRDQDDQMRAARRLETIVGRSTCEERRSNGDVPHTRS